MSSFVIPNSANVRLQLDFIRARGLSAPQVITATTPPGMNPLNENQTPADGYSPGVYTSTAGTIVSAVPTYLVNGVVQAADYDLLTGQSVQVSVLVTDSVGNTRSFLTNSITVTAIPPAAWSVTAGDGSATVDDYPTIPTTPAWMVSAGDASATVTAYPGMT